MTLRSVAALSRIGQPSLASLLAVCAICLAAVVPFLSTLTAYFTGDDFGLVRVYSDKPWSHFLTLFASPWTDEIYGRRPDELRPLIALSYQIDALWGPASPIAYHASNIVYHVLTTLLVFVIARTVAGLALPAATFAGLLFAVMPIHAEPVAWISGRADSIPTLFYLGSFLAYAVWRRAGRSWVYGASLVLFFLALYSKQSAITLLGALVLYDALVERGRPWRSWSLLRGYLPFAGLTLYYLVLRYVLFGNFVRENEVGAENLVTFLGRQAAYVQAVAFGAKILRPESFTPFVALVGIALAVWPFWARLSGAGRTFPVRWGAFLFFGPAWWVITVAPLFVTYFSLRHLYLPSAGVAIALGLGLNALWGTRQPLWRSLSVLGGACLIVAQAVSLQTAVTAWNSGAAVSEKLLREVQQVAAAAPPGTLLVIEAPFGIEERNTAVWVWSWALPFAAEPPFSPASLKERVSIVSNQEAYCCPPEQWLADTRQTVTRWAARGDRGPVEVLWWDPSTGAVGRRSSVDRPPLRDAVLRLADARTPEDIRSVLRALLEMPAR